jgi:uncharacterized protein YfaS (alpha-2-macroglobulin family)
MSALALRGLLWLACTLPLTVIAGAEPAKDGGAQVQLFSPQGYVKQVRQVTARFSAPMVALGDPRLEDPFTVTCAVRGHGRWADTRNWVYDFDSDLDGGIRCEFRLKPGLKSLTGTAVGGQSVFDFNTGGPAIIASLPREGWEVVDEAQIFLLGLDAAATPQSIETHAYCTIEGLAEQIPLEVLPDKDRQTILEHRKKFGYDYLELLWKSGLVSNVRVRNRALEKRDEFVAAVRCRRPLPPGSRVTLNWSAGIVTPSGIATQEDQQLTFKVRSAFTARVECTRTNAHAGCMPMMPIVVNFTAPVPRDLALRIRIKSSDGRTFAPAGSDPTQVPTVEGITFVGPFPEKSPLLVVLPPDLRDDAGRALENAQRFPLQVQVDAYPPLVKFSAAFGILEAHEGGVLPVTLRNVEATVGGQRAQIPAQTLRIDSDPKVIADWLHRVEEAERPKGYWSAEVWHDTTGADSLFQQSDATTRFSLTKPSGAKPEEVVGIPLGRPGFYVVELQSQALGAALLGRDQPRYVAASALVTDLSVHFKWGRESSLIWVTRLSDGTPVAEANVTAADACTGETLWQGKSGHDGIALVTSSLGEPSGYGGCSWRHPLMVIARKGQDFTVTESTWSQGIMPQEFGLPVGNEASANIYHTVLDRSLFRAGETVSMKHFLRQHVSAGLAIPTQAQTLPGPHHIKITHQGSGQTFNFTSVFDATGVAVGTWRIPEEAKLGDYRVTIDSHPSADFKVEQFRLPSMRATISGPPLPLVAPRQVDLDIHVAYLAGGGAAGLPVKVRTLIEPQPQHFDDYPDYEFDGMPVQEGVTTEGGGSEDYDFEADVNQETTRTQTTPLTLDPSGSGRATVASVPTLNGPSRLVAELEYADANGELLTSTGYVRLVPAEVTLGIRRESWVGSPGQVRFRVVALGLDGKPLTAQPVQVSLYQSNTYSYRKRLMGGFYSYETTREVKRLAPVCTGKTNPQGLLACELAPGSSGEIIVRAETRDAHGRVAGATTTMWVLDNDAWWFGGTSGDRMDVLPEKKEYEAGETARLQVRVPFRNATALVTIEREGVLSSFVTRLRGNSPIVNVPIDATYAPNVFVSVLAVRGRIAHVEGPKRDEITALVDLTKPAYRLGTTQIKVGWRPHRLLVAVAPEKTVFKVRDKAQVRIHVTTAMGQALPPGTEVAVAAVDEALLDLSPNRSWDLLQAMMGTRGLEVWTSTAQMQVIGKRHYGRKAIPSGGGGGREMDRARELFDSLLFWQARVPLDAQGEATISIPLNDSLSSFRIVGIAHAGAQLFGSGGSSIRTTQDLILTSGLPPLVREGDHYAATFTARNTTDRTLSAHLQVNSHTLKTPLAARDVEIPSGQARDLSWDVVAPVGTDHIDWDVTAADSHGDARDHLKAREQVIPVYPVRTYQGTIEQLTQPLSIPAQQPLGSVPGRGGLDITLQSQLAGNLTGVKEYLSLYPYTCLEQLISRAVGLRSREQWDRLMQRLPAYMDGDGLLKYFPTDRLDGDDTLTAYVLAIAQESAWPIRDDDRSRMQRALTAFIEGKIQRGSALPTADLTIRKLQALDALSRYGLARPAMLDSLAFEPNLLPTSALLDWVGVLERTPDIPNAGARSREALAILRSRLNFQGTTMGFSTEHTDGLWWLMISSDSNANRLLLTVLRNPEWRADIPRLVRGALGRQQFGHWNTTVANAWGVLAMEKFSAAFESTPVIGSTSVRYGADQHSISWPQQPGQSGTVSVPWHSGMDTLQLSHTGSGAPWAMVRATAALPLTQPLSTGFKIVRSIMPVEQQTPGHWARGDVVRIHLELEAQSDMSWVVVDDPVPSGASILGSGLANQSNLLQRDDTSTGWAFPAFEERRFDGFRAYYRFVPKGTWTVEYTVRLNNPGTFELPATRVEAMYAPEMLGELPNSTVLVQP